MISRRTFLASVTGTCLEIGIVKSGELTALPGEVPRFSVVRLHGVPTIYHYSRPILPMAHFALTMTPKAVRDFNGAGIHFFTFHLNTGPATSPYCPRTDCYPLQTGTLDEIAQYTLKENPEGYLMPRVLLWGPRDQVAWDKEHPGESYLDHPSLGSAAWKAAAEADLRRLLRHIEASSYRDRVLGYHVGWGTCGEWMYWGWDQPNALDRSPAILRAFGEWLNTRYRGDLAELRKAWNKPNANFENALAPLEEDLRSADLGMFIDPARTRIVADYYEFLSDLNVELIHYFGKVVKEETKQQALYGVFYGYDIHSNYDDFRLRASAHCGLKRLLGMSEVDFICSPNGYYDRNIGGMDCPQGVLASPQLHGKVYFNEVDNLTYLSHLPESGESHLRVENPRDTREVLRRSFCQSLVEGCALWWMTNEANGYWYSVPDILQDLKHMAQIHRFGLETDRESVAQVAVVLDDRSVFYLKLDPEQNVMNSCVFSQFFELRRMGASYSTFTLDDVVSGRVPPHKVYLFLNAFAVSAPEREALHKVLQRDRAVAVWIYAAGLINSGLDLMNIEKLTGIHTGADPVRGSLDLKITDGEHQLTRRLGAGFEFKSNLRKINSWQTPPPENPICSPVFFADDPKASTLGILTANSKPGYAVKSVDEWRSVYMAGAPAPAAAWRELVRCAGAPILNEEPDVLYANRSWLALHTDKAGSRRIKLPFRAEGVYEVFGRKTIAKHTDEFTFEAEHYKTYLFYLGPEDRIISAIGL